MILILSISLIILGISFLVFGLTVIVFALCKAAKNGDRLMQHEIDAEELNHVSKRNNRATLRAALGRILQ